MNWGGGAWIWESYFLMESDLEIYYLCFNGLAFGSIGIGLSLSPGNGAFWEYGWNLSSYWISLLA